ncbi:MAG: ParB N-terminal domain-containing protein [Clostridia bacterium]|nr:ParB N-terminal domain-containing protein [Clostridia bacterium]MBQ7792978.1 ParB N-terminal domain-containing protein [Clostridia bacterium]
MELKIEYLPIKALKPYEKNTRKHTDYDVGEIAKSITECGFNDPIGVYGESLIIVEGHGRLLAAKKLGMKEVPCIRLDHMTDEQRRKYAILHNKTAELSTFDFDNLAFELAELDLSDFDFDFGIENEGEVYSPDEFGDDFTLPDGDKPEICQMTFTLHQRQKELIEYAISVVKDDAKETFGNTNGNGNALYEVVKQWAELKK